MKESKAGIGHGPKRSRRHLGSIFRQHPATVARFWAPPSLQSRANLILGNAEIDRPGFRVDRDRVSIPHNREWPSIERLWRDVTHHEAMGASGETSVGNQRDVFAQATPHHGACRREHFAHARSAARTLIANHDDIAFFDVALEDRPHGGLLAVKDPGLPAESLPFLAADLCDGASGCEIAPKNHQMAVF